ncbi:glycoside hydrolase family 3 protein [Maribacter sp. 2210JD10-5]|uniref:glycoside hydrolase family 3 protein n=1 Tax=Maribacter sp. 2210JD10-5 TaxID=3386272 RepID=UPI0039BD8D4C
MPKSTTPTELKKSISLKEKVGQLFMPAVFINDTEQEIREMEELIAQYYVGGLCFFHSRASAATNFESKKEVIYNADSYETLKTLINRYQNVSKYPLLIAIDAEWGLAMRVENTPQYPYAITMGAMQNATELLFEVGKNIANNCKTAGIHWNLAPCVDLNNNPNNPVIGYRSFGENKELVTEKASAFIKGTQSEGVLTSIKHFPGHGDTATDSHLGLPLIEKSETELVKNELYPFQKLIDEGVDSVMVGHLSVPSLANGKRISSSISKEIIKGVLRKEMGFDGVVISDALNMHAVAKNYPTPGELEWLAFDAGNDVLCFAEHTKEGIDTILSKASKHQIEESFERIWKLKAKAFKIEKLNSKRIPSSELNIKIAAQSLTLFSGTEEVIASFRNTDYCTLTLKRWGNQTEEEILKDLKTIAKEVSDEENILLLLTPPQVKPNSNFGFLPEEIDFINQLISEKKVVLYHYGNPYALRLFKTDKTLATVIVYQDFKEFQEVATAHFMGKLKANGKLPVKLK